MSADDGVLDSDTRRTLASGRQTAGDMVGAARDKLRWIFVVFVIGLLVTIYAMRVWIWPILRRDLLARGAEIVVITPFDVILLQAKIGIIVGIVMALPAFLYTAREPLKQRGWYPSGGVASWKLVTIAVLSTLLFVGGVVYSYNIFFPVMFDFLAHNAINAGLSPTYSIVDWTQFILILGLSFGLAAQLPLVMTALSYAEIVPYETFRDKWKYAIVGMFGFGALFSPPDPFTQLMWAGPLVVLYAFSLYLARLAVAFKRGRDAIDLVGSVRANLPAIVGAFVVVAGAGFWLLTDGVGYLNRLLIPRLPAIVRPSPLRPEAILPLQPTVGALVVALVLGLLAAAIVLLYYAWPRLEAPESFGDPTAIDLDDLDAAGVRAAPPEVFAALSEEEAVEHARHAMDADDPEKAQSILDRFDEATEAEAEGASEAASLPEEQIPEDSSGGGGGGGLGGLVGRTTTGIMGSFTEDEPTEDEIGGYYHDIAFVFDSLRSKAFRLFAVFISVLVGVFSFLYSGGIGAIKEDFLRRLPAVVRPEEVQVITLHPVEALVFEVKIATLLGAVAVLPMLLYYAWPPLASRNLVSGDRNIFFSWAGALIGGLFVGSAIGYLYIAPAVVSYFVWDAFQANMVIAYRVSNFFWLIFFTTVGIGIMLDIPVTMVMFHRGGIVTYRTMRARWREVLLTVMAVAAIFTPATILSMILVAIPVMIAYGFGLGVLWLYTLGGRRTTQPTARSG